MKPYFETSNGALYHGDCIEVLTGIEVKADLCITDPPYIIDDCGGGGSFGSKNRQYHRDIESRACTLKRGFDLKLTEILSKYLNKLNAYFFANKNLLAVLMDKYKEYNYDILVICKTNPIPTCNNKYLSDIEYVLYVRDKGVPLYGDYKSKSKFIIETNFKNKIKHPTVKPTHIVSRYITNSSTVNDLVIDPFIGSGTTAVACEMTNRRWIGIEIDEEYCEIAAKRIEEASKQYELFERKV